MSRLNGFFTLRTPADLLEKLEADFNRLKAASQDSREAQYAALDFFVCAEHFPEWILAQNGGSITEYRAYPDGPIVSHLASGAKHFRVDDHRHTTVKDTLVEPGAFQENAFQTDAFHTAQLVVELESGGVESAVDLASRVLEHWRTQLRG